MAREADRAQLGDQLRATLRKVPASVAVITTGRGDDALGMTATAVTSVSLAPPALLVCVNNALRLNTAIRAAGRFRITYLRREQEAIARAFGGAASCEERFGSGDWNRNADYGPDLAAPLASIACTLVDAHESGTHSIFVGHVASVRNGAGAPLLYCDGGYADLLTRPLS